MTLCHGYPASSGTGGTTSWCQDPLDHRDTKREGRAELLPELQVPPGIPGWHDSLVPGWDACPTHQTAPLHEPIPGQSRPLKGWRLWTLGLDYASWSLHAMVKFILSPLLAVLPSLEEALG